MICAILVLYKKNVSSSATFRSLVAPQNRQALSDVNLIVYANCVDNDTRRALDEIKNTDYGFASYEYIISNNNNGIAIPYNVAYHRAQLLKCDWLLLLDDDSSLSENYLALMLCSAHVSNTERVAAIVPTIMVGSRRCAPRRGFLGKVVGNNDDLHTIGTYVTTVNSGALISIRFLRALDGFDETYWLDGLDTWLFMKIYETGRTILSVHAVVHHNLSLADGGVSVERIGEIVRSECKLWVDFPNVKFRTRVGLGIAKRSMRFMLNGKWAHVRKSIFVLGTSLLSGTGRGD